MLINTSNGDLRRSITYLQSASRLAHSTDPPSAITPADIQEIAGVVPDAVINDFAASLGIDVETADGMDVDDDKKVPNGSFDAIRAKVKEIVREGYSASQLLSQLHDLIVEHQTLTARQKSQSALALAEADKALCDGADEELWILEVALNIHKAVS